jgi:hypothetical protein
MIDAAGLGIAFCAKPNVQKTVNDKSFPGGSTINVLRLDLAVLRYANDTTVSVDGFQGLFRILSNEPMSHIILLRLSVGSLSWV